MPRAPYSSCAEYRFRQEDRHLRYPQDGRCTCPPVYEREVRVYSDLLPKFDIPQPKIYCAIYEADGHEKKLRDQTKKVDRFPLWLMRWLIKREQSKSDVPPCVLLIEDIVDGEVGDHVTGGSPEKIPAGLSTLARLHAATWRTKTLPQAHWLEGPDTIPRLIQALYLNGHDEFLRQAAPHILHRLTGLAEVADLGDGRGVELMAEWLRRADARLQRVTA